MAELVRAHKPHEFVRLSFTARYDEQRGIYDVAALRWCETRARKYDAESGWRGRDSGN